MVSVRQVLEGRVGWAGAFAAAAVLLFIATLIVAPREARRRRRRLGAAGAVMNGDAVAGKLAEGWKLFRIDFGYGAEIWIAPAQPLIGPDENVLVGGYFVLEPTPEQYAAARHVIFRR